MEELHALDWGAPLHAMVIPGEMHVLEKELVDFYQWQKVLARRTGGGH
jgi:diphthamide biosynthesis methyltransferase